jgi:hypothetical protein
MMLIWVDEHGSQTHLTGFSKTSDSLMRPIIHLIEEQDKWILRTLDDDQWSKIITSGNGCADPTEYIERMIYPNIDPEPEPSMIMFYHLIDGDSFQVYDPDAF